VSMSFERDCTYDPRGQNLSRRTTKKKDKKDDKDVEAKASDPAQQDQERPSVFPIRDEDGDEERETIQLPIQRTTTRDGKPDGTDHPELETMRPSLTAKPDGQDHVGSDDEGLTIFSDDEVGKAPSPSEPKKPTPKESLICPRQARQELGESGRESTRRRHAEKDAAKSRRRCTPPDDEG